MIANRKSKTITPQKTKVVYRDRPTGDISAVVKGFSDMKGKYKAKYAMSVRSKHVRQRTGVASQGSGADFHYNNESDYYKDIEQERDMDRNDPLIGPLSDRRVDNIVQSGFKLDPKTGDKKLDLDLWQRWQAIANDPDLCDVAGELTWLEMERQACRSSGIDGDCLIVGTEDGSFQFIEGHLVRTKTRIDDTFLGVTTNAQGKRLKYHIAEEVDKFGTFGECTPIDARDSDGVRQVFHVYDPRRAYQTRGVGLLAPLFPYAGMLEDINFAKLVQQQVVSCFAIFRKKSGGTSLPSRNANYGESGSETTATGGTRFTDNIGPGMEYEGDDLQGFSPNVPNAEYFQQVRLILQIMGVNFGLPLCLVLMDGSETNFSGWRGAVDEARKGFVADQQNLVRRLHTPAYRWQLSRWLKEDTVLANAAKRSRIDVFGHNWNLPTWSYIEPVADAEGDATQLKNSLTSPRRLHSARGNDWEEISEEIVDDNLYAIENAAKKAATFNAANPTSPQLTWRDLIALPMPDGVQMTLQDPVAVEAQAASAEAKEEPAAGGEMVGMKRSDWKNSRKAINDLLNEFSTGKISEHRVRMELDSMGVPPNKVDAYVYDAADGSLTEPLTEEALANA